MKYISSSSDHHNAVIWKLPHRHIGVGISCMALAYMGFYGVQQGYIGGGISENNEVVFTTQSAGGCVENSLPVANTCIGGSYTTASCVGPEGCYGDDINNCETLGLGCTRSVSVCTCPTTPKTCKETCTSNSECLSNNCGNSCVAGKSCNDNSECGGGICDENNNNTCDCNGATKTCQASPNQGGLCDGNDTDLCIEGIYNCDGICSDTSPSTKEICSTSNTEDLDCDGLKGCADTDCTNAPGCIIGNPSIYTCQGPAPTVNATLCPDDEKGLSSNIAYTAISTCTPTKCEYTCNQGYSPKNGTCEKDSPGGNTGAPIVYTCPIKTPANGALCTRPNPSNANTSYTYNSFCDTKPLLPCQFTCEFLYTLNATKDGCIPNGTTPPSSPTPSPTCGSATNHTTSQYTTYYGTSVTQLSGVIANQQLCVNGTPSKFIYTPNATTAIGGSPYPGFTRSCIGAVNTTSVSCHAIAGYCGDKYKNGSAYSNAGSYRLETSLEDCDGTSDCTSLCKYKTATPPAPPLPPKDTPVTPPKDTPPVTKPNPPKDTDTKPTPPKDTDTNPTPPVTKPIPESKCPNNKVEAGEECDDGNSVNNDGCNQYCKLDAHRSAERVGGGSNYCGDGIRRSTEECDDGNYIDKDGCDSNCKTEGKYTPTPPANRLIVDAIQKMVLNLQANCAYTDTDYTKALAKYKDIQGDDASDPAVILTTFCITKGYNKKGSLKFNTKSYASIYETIKIITKIVALSEGIKFDEKYPDLVRVPYTDVRKGRYIDYVNYAADIGLLEGVAKGKNLKGMTPISTDQLATMLANIGKDVSKYEIFEKNKKNIQRDAMADVIVDIFADKFVYAEYMMGQNITFYQLIIMQLAGKSAPEQEAYISGLITKIKTRDPIKLETGLRIYTSGVLKFLDAVLAIR